MFGDPKDSLSFQRYYFNILNASSLSSLERKENINKKTKRQKWFLLVASLFSFDSRKDNLWFVNYISV